MFGPKRVSATKTELVTNTPNEKETVTKTTDEEWNTYTRKVYRHEVLEKMLNKITTVSDTIVEKLDNIFGIVSQPPRIHPETEMLRAEQKERVAFLEGMVKDLSKRAATTSEPMIKEVIKEVEVKTDINKLPKEELKTVAEKLSDAELLAIVRGRKK